MLFETFQYLNQINLVNTQYEFSRDWLGQTQSYYSALRSTGRQPSVEVLMRLKLKLQQVLRQFQANDRRLLLLGSAFDMRAGLKLHIDALDALIEQRCEPRAA